MLDFMFQSKLCLKISAISGVLSFLSLVLLCFAPSLDVTPDIMGIGFIGYGLLSITYFALANIIEYDNSWKK